MSPRVSVIVPTYRWGGIDLLKWSLDHQDYPPDRFELILVDALYSYRAEAVGRCFGGRGTVGNARYDVVHCPPAQLAGEEPAGFRDLCPRYRNTGIQRATGEILVFWSDYTLALPAILSLHVHRLTALRRPAVVCGTHLYGRISPHVLRPDVTVTDIDEYERTLLVMPLDDPRWISIFNTSPDGVFTTLTTLDTPAKDLDQKLFIPNATAIFPAFAHWKNESLTREAAEKVAGFDEHYNDTHCYDDMDFSYRVHRATGAIFVLDKAIEVSIANPRPLTPLLRRAWSVEEAKKDWEQVRAKEIDAGATLPRRSILLP